MFVLSPPSFRSASAVRSVHGRVRVQAITSGESDITAVSSGGTSVRKLRTLSKKNAAAAKAPAEHSQPETSPGPDRASGRSAAEATEAEQKV